MERILSILSALGIKATAEDVEAINDLHEIEETLPVAQERVADLREQLSDAEGDLASVEKVMGDLRIKIGAVKIRSQSSGLPIESCDHRSRGAATLYYLRQRATVEPIHRAEIAQYVYGDRSDLNQGRLSMVLSSLKRKLLVRNGPRGYWFPL